MYVEEGKIVDILSWFDDVNRSHMEFYALTYANISGQKSHKT